MKFTKEKLERKINRIKTKIESLKEEHGDNPTSTHTYHGGWTLGYWEGKLSVLEDDLLALLEKVEDYERALLKIVETPEDSYNSFEDAYVETVRIALEILNIEE